MVVQLPRKIVAFLWRALCVIAWSVLGLWTALAVIYCVPLPAWVTAVLALVVGILYVRALPERLFVLARPLFFWRERRRSLMALAATTLVLIWYFGFVTPNPNEDWIPKHARMPHVEIDGDKVHVTNVRNFTWHTPTDFTPEYDDRTFDLNALNSVYYVPTTGSDTPPEVYVSKHIVYFSQTLDSHRDFFARSLSFAQLALIVSCVGIGFVFIILSHKISTLEADLAALRRQMAGREDTR